MSVSPAELEELEEVEGWVNLMAELEGMEQDHLIELSLRHADKSKIAQIKAAALSKAKQKVHHKHHSGHRKHASAQKA
jgi:putative heme degradation protein